MIRAGSIVRLRTRTSRDERAALVRATLDPETPGGLFLDLDVGGCRYWNVADVVEVKLSKTQRLILDDLLSRSVARRRVTTEYTLDNDTLKFKGFRHYWAVRGLIEMGILVHVKEEDETLLGNKRRHLLHADLRVPV